MAALRRRTSLPNGRETTRSAFSMLLAPEGKTAVCPLSGQSRTLESGTLHPSRLPHDSLAPKYLVYPIGSAENTLISALRLQEPEPNRAISDLRSLRSRTARLTGSHFCRFVASRRARAGGQTGLPRQIASHAVRRTGPRGRKPSRAEPGPASTTRRHDFAPCP